MGFPGYLATIIVTGVAATAVTGALVWQVVRLIMRQVKLYHSINLVELKTRKFLYWLFAAVVGFLIFYIIMQMADPDAPGVGAFNSLFGATRTQANMVFMFALIVMIASETFIVALALSRSAVVDKGVYTNFGMLDWHQVRDYLIDEEKCILVLSTDRNTFSTLNGLTRPFKVAHGDIQKIKFILNKNKNKFSGFEDE